MGPNSFTALDGGSHRSSGSTSGAAILGAFIPTFTTAVIYLIIFALIRNSYAKFYAPRTFLGTIPEKDRTPQERVSGGHWFRDFRRLSDRFVLQHNSLDAYLFLRFLKIIVGVCVVGCLLTWPILFPVNAAGGGEASQLDRLTFGNVVKKNLLWVHVAASWLYFLGILVFVAWERLTLIGTRQAYYLSDEYASRLSSRTVLWLNAPREACEVGRLRGWFGEDAVKGWPVRDMGDLEGLVAKRTGAVGELERAELDLIVKAVKENRKGGAKNNGANGSNGGHVPPHQRPVKRDPPVVGRKKDKIDDARDAVRTLTERIEAHRAAPGRNIPAQSAIFVAFNSQPAAHRAFQQITFQPRLPIQDRFLAVQPKEVLWSNLAEPVPKRLSKASLALALVIVFTIFFAIPVGLISTISNVKYLANRYEWLDWINRLPPWLLGLLTGLLPPYLVSAFVSYVPKLFRHLAKRAGEPTVSQAELKTQAWYFVFQVFQIFIVTTTASGSAAVISQIAQNPGSAPELLANSLPKASNFYLTYFILQGTASAASNILNYSDLFEYFWDDWMAKTPREKFQVHASMKGTPWAAWFPKFTNLFVIAIAYSMIAPLVLGFAAVGIFLYYLSYRYQLLYVRQTKIDTRGEAYKRALQQTPTGIYLAELCLIGLMGARKAAAQTALMVVLLVLTAILNFLLDRMLRPLELYLGVDIWQEMEVPLLAEEDEIDPSDQEALHGASHSRRLGLGVLPNPAPRILSDFFDSIMSAARRRTADWLSEPSANREQEAEAPLKDEDMEKAYLAPAFTSKTPKLWIPRDGLGISKKEIEANEKVGLQCTDEGAEVDEEGRLHWNHDFEHVPVWKAPTRI